MIARQVNAALGTHLAPWDVGQIDDTLIAIIEHWTRPRRSALPRAPEIEQRKAEIRAAHNRSLGRG